MNRFHTASEYFLGTGPIVFHSFCNLDEKTVICEIVEAMEYDTFTTFQSVLSFSASAFSHNAFFFSEVMPESFYLCIRFPKRKAFKK